MVRRSFRFASCCMLCLCVLLVGVRYLLFVDCCVSFVCVLFVVVCV